MLHFGGLELSRQEQRARLSSQPSSLPCNTCCLPRPSLDAVYVRQRRIARWRRQLDSSAKILIAITFGLGSALAGIAGALLANLFVYPTGGISLSVLAYIAVVIGGGALPVPCLVRFSSRCSKWWVSASLSYAVATGCLYATLLLIFLLRPQGSC